MLSLGGSLLCLPGCSGQPALDSAPAPQITFLAPSPNGAVHGKVPVQVQVKGVAPLSSVAFTAPASLVSAQPSFVDSYKTSATLLAVLDASGLADGPVTITAAAEDELGHRTTQDLQVTVQSRGASITVASPSEQATVKGTVSVTAQATPDSGGNVVSFVMVDAPPGMGMNAASDPGSFSATWDTTKALEGAASLHFRATDNAGTVSDKTLTVVVDNVPPGSFDVRVSAGAPIQGATVAVMAIDDSTGAVNTAIGQSGLLGVGGPTDANGKATVVLTTENYVGPVQVIASGTALSYSDPSAATPTNIQIPAGFTFTSYLASYASGTGVTTPLSLWTTLADHEALAYAKGLHPAHPGKSSLSSALTLRDQLFVKHITASATAWSPAALRWTVPVMLTAGSQTLLDASYAGLFDVALNQLARDTALKAGYGSDSSAINAISLAQLLEQDLDADAQFNGKGPQGTLLRTLGTTPVTLDSQFLRVPLATALDEWIRSSLNRSGISRTDLTNAGVYDAITADATDLFGDPPSLGFDTTPPSVVATFTYSVANGPQNAAPVGANKNLVGGIVTVTVDAADVSGVASIAVTVSGSAVSRDLQRSTASHFVGTWDTTKAADGPVSFVVTAIDTMSNAGTTTFTLVADNTPPSISVAKPLPSAFYSTAIDLDVTATDAGAAPSGVASLTQLGLAGFLSADSNPAHLVGTWDTSAVAAGATSVATTFTATDLVGNSTNLQISIHLDRTPPALSWAVTPPAAIQHASDNLGHYSLLLKAFDSPGAGVKAVHARVGTSFPVDGTLQPDGSWLVTVQLASSQHNSIAVWADDLALPVANSGVNALAPYQLTADILIDNTPPTATSDGAFASYYDERGMTILVDGSGRAQIPAQYSKGPLVVIPSGSSIYKTATRLGSGGTPNIAEIESTNANNTPTLRFVVPYSAATDSAIVNANFTALVSSGGSTPIAASGALFPSTRTDPSNLYFDLPLSSDIVPPLASVAGAATVSVTLSLADAAGNTASVGPFTYTFHVIGPVVAIVEDTSYPTAGDPKAATSYTVTAAAYASLFTYSPAFLPEQQVRLVRYLVSNPASTPVAVTAPVSGSVAVNETWSTDNASMSGNYAADGFLFQGTVSWGDQCDAIPQYPGETAGSAPQSWTYLSHSSGMGQQYSVENYSGQPWDRANSAATIYQAETAAPGTLAYVVASDHEGSAAQVVAGEYVVPAAQGTVPGEIAIYVTRPAATSRAQLPLNFTKVNPTSSTPPRFEIWRDDAWLNDGVDRACTHVVTQSADINQSQAACLAFGADPSAVVPTSDVRGSGCRFNQDSWWNARGYACVCYMPDLPGWSGIASPAVYTWSTNVGSIYRNWQSYRFVNYLAQSVEQLSGSLGLVSQGLLPNLQPFGEPQTLKSGVSFARTLSH
ncbi:Ig-like domain-containing protein [Anaeromyxobacter paludicola]|uniref:Ig-like domain-containing protein n=1 Tax=Anaeromyxobacter paludicola TaxID=2918171 RepID=UPI0020C0E22A|nr:Ig-like domain-containing protein [Anaeromyxobacter paludicola]